MGDGDGGKTGAHVQQCVVLEGKPELECVTDHILKVEGSSVLQVEHQTLTHKHAMTDIAQVE